jgi:hypothetical protein
MSTTTPKPKKQSVVLTAIRFPKNIHNRLIDQKKRGITIQQFVIDAVRQRLNG